MVHAGVRDTTKLVVRKLTVGAGPVAGPSDQELADYVVQNCTGAPVPLHLVAADGLTMNTVRTVHNAIMQPAIAGTRSSPCRSREHTASSTTPIRAVEAWIT